ncbi:MAG: hypothetical protein K2Y08_04955 [Alphaproteobacteria bacterium]|nr:hypothetical protein [Alphaproteobacteria bacterium]
MKHVSTLASLYSLYYHRHCEPAGALAKGDVAIHVSFITWRGERWPCHFRSSP